MRYKQGSFANPEDALVAAKGDADEAKKLMGYVINVFENDYK